MVRAWVRAVVPSAMAFAYAAVPQAAAQPAASIAATNASIGRNPLPDSLLARLPFAPGEVLQYQVNVALGGRIGQGEMRVEGPVAERGVSTLRLVSEMRAKRGFVRATDRSVSWLDPARVAVTRFEKEEKHPLSNSRETVEIDRTAGTWRDEDGRVQELASPLPLDELSFLYFLRTIPLDREGSYNFTRHFDVARNPTLVSVGPEEVLETPAGTFHTRVVLMHVRDPKHYKGIGLIRLNIETSGCRVPVRIISKMPIVGTTTLTLTAHQHVERAP